MITIQIPTYDHIPQLLQLNQLYLVNHLTQVQQQGGSVRIAYASNEIKLIIDAKEIVVAFNGEIVVGYYLIGKKSNKDELHYQKKYTISLFDTNQIQFNAIGYACQVCINENYRNQNLFKDMLTYLTCIVKHKYHYLLCSISKTNNVSLTTHLKNGWKVLNTFEEPLFLIYTTQPNTII